MRGKIDDELLVRLWCEGKTLDAIATAVGASKQAVSMRASKLRVLGVKLPKLSSRAPNVTALNAIIEAAKEAK